MRTRSCIAALVWISVAGTLGAQDPLKIGDVIVSGSLRTRIESWDWFQGNADNDYTFPGSIFKLSLAESKPDYDWQVEFALPFLLGLPKDAIAPAPQGQLGLGASYFAANSASNTAMLFVKQGYVRLKAIGGVDGQSITAGRMEVIDGTEVTPANSTLAAIKRDRIASRLLGNFAFSEAGRSFDGVQYALNRSNLNFTAFGGRPTRGSFQVDGWGELNINVFYGALTGQIGARKKSASEWRVFGLGYNDQRDGVLKTDDRPLALRKSDLAHINIGTYGGHFLNVTDTPAGVIDFLFWGALQNGSWGSQAQRAGAFAAESGWQPPVLARVKPWIRGGYDYGSGDKNPNDSTHGTFFPALPTPRTYARFPFFNMMNTRDAFGELMLRPAKRVTVRSDAHSLRLASANDLWYSGGGAFQPWSFGYTGRASGGQSSLATFYDSSVEIAFSRHFATGLYYGYADGKAVPRAIYPTGKNANFGFVEMTYKF